MPHKDPEAKRAYFKAYRLLHAATIEEKKASYRRTHAAELCEKAKAYRINNLAKVKATKARYAKEHSQEIVAKVYAWNQANPERFHVKQVLATQRRRARKKNALVNDFTKTQWEEMKDQYGHRCVYCHKKCQRLTMDHITPLTKGGNHTRANIVPACHTCNVRKNAQAPPSPVQPMLL